MTASTRELRDRWLNCPQPRPDAEARLFCLPYAGAGASAFRAWPSAFGPRVEVVALQLPGREQRMRERPVIEPHRVAAAVAAAADHRPYAIFGHSMGGRLAFEVVRELRRTGGPLPARLYPSGAIAPHIPVAGPYSGVSTMEDEELARRLAEGGGVPAAVLAEPDLFALFLPILRADLGWIDEYVYTDEPALPVPVVAFAGEADRVAPAAQMLEWERHTAAGFAMHTLRGGHFFQHERLDELARLIKADLLGTPGGPDPRGPGLPGAR